MSVGIPLLRVAIEAGGSTGLQTDSWIMLEKLSVMRRTRLRKRIGAVDVPVLIELERKLLPVLGLAR